MARLVAIPFWLGNAFIRFLVLQVRGFEMGDYSRNGQYGDLKGAVDKAKKGRFASKKSKGAFVAGTLIAAGLIGGGLTLANSGDVPPHEERVAYFIREYSDEWFEMGYSPDFSEAGAWSTAREHFWVYVAYPPEPGRRTRKLIGVVDGLNMDDPADGEPDWAWAQLASGRVGTSCHIEYTKLPEDIQEMLTEFYEAGSEGFYKNVTDGTESYEGNIGDDEFLEFWSACRELQEN